MEIVLKMDIRTEDNVQDIFEDFTPRIYLTVSDFAGKLSV